MKRFMMLFCSTCLVIFASATLSFGSDKTAPITTATPAGGTYSTAQSVTLSVNEPATTYFTTDGTTPTTSSPVYSSPITISTTCILSYFSKDTAGNVESVKTQYYTITTKVHDINNTSLTWTGYGMCRTCHSTEANEMFNSVHYQWRGASGMTTGPATQGKFSATPDNSTPLNAYCINILGNWNTYAGCSTCHVGLGALPSPTPSDAQLDNIDCLLCHQKDYKRIRVNGGLYAPYTTAMTITMNQAVRTVTKPVRAACLQCHAKAAGGDAFKRGDMALAQGATTDTQFDVHMATTGANLPCQSCHTTANHRMAGRGSDLRVKDSDTAMGCSTTTCHPGKDSLTAGHSSTDIDHHTGRVACQTCHIPVYAKNATDTAATEATETFRTWKTSVYNAPLKRYEPTLTLNNDLMPKYAFFNGTSWGINMFDTPVLDPATGTYKIDRPNGTINDPVGTKLYPFKYKTSEMPLNTYRNTLIAVDTSKYFATGIVDDAINQGMVNMGYTSGEPFTYVITDEYQLITHEVPPATGNVLACADCHKNTTRIDLPGMGYVLKAAKPVICSQCHNERSYTDYKSIHDIHVTQRKKDCSWCHNFSRQERGLQ
ncbi:MAG TPA: chitobiase/beta-hexosaminidase C-terminal domain-containing protein [Geobacteraceae bacterium]